MNKKTLRERFRWREQYISAGFVAAKCRFFCVQLIQLLGRGTLLPSQRLGRLFLKIRFVALFLVYFSLGILQYVITYTNVLYARTVLTLHERLQDRIAWYKRYHNWKWQRAIHGGVAAIYIVSIFGFLIINFAKTFANSTLTSWDFGNSNQYTLSDGLELGTNEARLKAQNYATDDATAALYHLDEVSSPVLVDSSASGSDGLLAGGSFVSGNLNNGLQLNGTNEDATVPHKSSLNLGQQHTIEAWTKLQSNFSANSTDQRQGIVDKGDYALYYDNQTGRIAYELANNTAQSWGRVAGNDIKSSWDTDGKTGATASVSMGGKLYTGTGIALGDAEVWVKDGATWKMIGGDDINGSWADQTFEAVRSLTTDGTLLYAGLGDTAGDAEVWSWDGSAWTKIGGDAINNSWQLNTFEAVQDMTVMNGVLYVGLGNSANDAEVWSWDGSAWTKIGGDSLNSGWATNYEQVSSLVNDGTHLYAGLGTSANDAEVWRWNGTTWTKIGGDAVGASWGVGYETVRSLAWHGGILYAGLGNTADDAEVWSWNGTTWTKIGGDAVGASWDTSYEYVMSLYHDGTHLYAGLGASNGDGEVWRWNGTTWTKIGGDNLNGGWTATTGDVVYDLAGQDGRLYASLYDSSGSGYVYSYDGTAWTLEGGQYVNESWGYYGQGSVEKLFSAHGKLYAGLGSAAGSAQVWEYNGDTDKWGLIGGQGVRNSWDANVSEVVSSMTNYGSNLVVGLGNSANGAEAWSYNGSTWTKIGGSGLNAGWTATYEEVSSLASYGGFLYAGLGVSANDAEVWRWNGTTWTKIGGDSLNSGWTANFERVMSMTIYAGEVYVGLGTSANDAEVWRWDGSTWTKIGGDGDNNSWSDNIEQIESMVAYDSKLYIGTGTGAGDGDVWAWDGTAWEQIGGDEINSSWTAGTYELARSLTVYNGDLYAGLGSTTGDGELWRYSAGTWEKVGGNFTNNSWGNAAEEVESLSVYRGKLYAGTGNSANIDAAVYAYGNNGYLESSTTSFGTEWRHVAATYDGAKMKLYINGQLNASADMTLSVASTGHDMRVGSLYGATEQGRSQGYFTGILDEIRLSNTVRAEFTTLPYTNTPQTVSLSTSVLAAGVDSLDSFAATEVSDGGNVTYRLSNDDGGSWLYWDGLAWSASDNLSEANTATVINDAIANLSTTFYGVKWQAILSGDGKQRPSLLSVSVGSSTDVDSPEENASNIRAYKSNGGDVLTSNSWTNGSSPYFQWTDGADNGSGIKGYCLYLGTDSTADPATAKGLLGNSPEYPGTFCQFLSTDASVDLATPGYLTTPMSTQTEPYYLRVKAIDNAGNITASVAQFKFKFDNTPPQNPGYVTAPSGFINTKEVSLTWPTNGAQSPSDAASGVAGLQYRINESAWYGDNHTGSGDMYDLLNHDGSYATVEVPDHTNIQEGINTIYFRTWDVAGNVTTTHATAFLKVNTAGSPSEPQNLVASPIFNTTNAFSFDWDRPASFVGEANSVTYCYTINTVPSPSSCSYTNPGATHLGTGAYASQPGSNTLYVAARDESNNINYASYASVSFTANTPAPGIPTSVDIVDVSIKATSKWRLAITWEEPDSQGSGVETYRIYRSSNGASYSFVGSSSSTTYIDANLDQETYRYYVRACDNTNNCGANSTNVSMLPTGKFTEPAEMISNPQVTNITTKKATISWATNRTSDSKVSIGTTSGRYGSSEIGNSSQIKQHTIDLDNLAAGTTYYFVARWTDEDGNTGSSQEFTFTTEPAPVIGEIEIMSVGLSSAVIEFVSKGANRVNIYYGPSDSFGGLKSINTSFQESRYNFSLEGLNDGTKYFYRLSALDSEGSEYFGNTFSFNTPPRPHISNLRFQPVPGEPTSTQLVSWQTNVASTSMVTYGKVGSVGRDQQSSEMKTDHEIKITDLEDDSTYFIVAQGRDVSGNLAVSDRQQFRTALDTRPPKVTEISVESSIRGTGAEARGQVIMSWKTDEPAASQVGYSEGSNATVFGSRTAEDSSLKTEHLVIVSDLPTSKVYSLQPLSKDKAGNVATGEPQSAIIGRASENVLTIILNTLQKVFGL